MTIKSSFHSSIPVVDFRDLLSSDQKKKEAFRVKIGQAMHTLGFVAVVNTDLDSERLDKTYQVAKRFFDQTLAVKEIVTSRGNSGERGFVHVESPKEGGVAARDRKEFFHVGPEFAEKERKERGYYANVWPEDPEFKRTIRDLYECLISYIRPLATAISTKEEDLSSLVDRGEHLLRLIHYPGKMSPKEEWAAEHTDLNFFTILPPATSKGLQIKTADGTWIDCVVPPGALIFQAGDMLQNLTNGFYRSAPHRVVPNKEKQDRYSVVLFAHTKNENRLDPRPHFVEKMGGVRRFPKASRKELLEYYLTALGRASKEMKERVKNSGIIDRIAPLQNPWGQKIQEKVLKMLESSSLM